MAIVDDLRNALAELNFSNARVKELAEENARLKDRIEALEGNLADRIKRISNGLGKGKMLPVRSPLQTQDRF